MRSESKLMAEPGIHPAPPGCKSGVLFPLKCCFFILPPSLFNCKFRSISAFKYPEHDYLSLGL